MEVIAKSGKNAIIESDYIGFLYVTGNIRSAIYYRAETELIRIAKMKSLISCSETKKAPLGATL
ncbi:hypothetical protein [Klebsiella pneumoniae]